LDSTSARGSIARFLNKVTFYRRFLFYCRNLYENLTDQEFSPLCVSLYWLGEGRKCEASEKSFLFSLYTYISYILQVNTDVTVCAMAYKTVWAWFNSLLRILFLLLWKYGLWDLKLDEILFELKYSHRNHSIYFQLHLSYIFIYL
jgi:hypothetical protein